MARAYTYNDYNTDIRDMPTYLDLLSKYRINDRPDNFEEKSGSFNRTRLYKDNKLSLRISKEPIFVKNITEIIPYKQDVTIGDLKKAQDKTASNWKKAVQIGIAPAMYFYGYIKEPIPYPYPHEGKFNLYQVIISEAYDTDLHDYYTGSRYASKRIGDNPTSLDKLIVDKLISLLTISHRQIGMICFDIKPGNCVINIQDNGMPKRLPNGDVDLKLIDLEEDTCLQDLKITDAQLQYIDILSQIIMANHFFMPAPIGVGWNIFSDYFSNNMDGNYGPENVLSNENLTTLFCDLAGTKYDLIVRHYFFKGKEYMSCPDMLKEMIARCKMLRPPHNIHNKNVSSPAAIAAAAPTTVAAAPPPVAIAADADAGNGKDASEGEEQGMEGDVTIAAAAGNGKDASEEEEKGTGTIPPPTTVAAAIAATHTTPTPPPTTVAAAIAPTTIAADNKGEDDDAIEMSTPAPDTIAAAPCPRELTVTVLGHGAIVKDSSTTVPYNVERIAMIRSDAGTCTLSPDGIDHVALINSIYELLLKEQCVPMERLTELLNRIQNKTIEWLKKNTPLDVRIGDMEEIRKFPPQMRLTVTDKRHGIRTAHTKSCALIKLSRDTRETVAMKVYATLLNGSKFGNASVKNILNTLQDNYQIDITTIDTSKPIIVVSYLDVNNNPKVYVLTKEDLKNHTNDVTSSEIITLVAKKSGKGLITVNFVDPMCSVYNNIYNEYYEKMKEYSKQMKSIPIQTDEFLSNALFLLRYRPGGPDKDVSEDPLTLQNIENLMETLRHARLDYSKINEIYTTLMQSVYFLYANAVGQIYLSNGAAEISDEEHLAIVINLLRHRPGDMVDMVDGRLMFVKNGEHPILTFAEFTALRTDMVTVGLDEIIINRVSDILTKAAYMLYLLQIKTRYYKTTTTDNLLPLLKYRPWDTFEGDGTHMAFDKQYIVDITDQFALLNFCRPLLDEVKDLLTNIESGVVVRSSKKNVPSAARIMCEKKRGKSIDAREALIGKTRIGGKKKMKKMKKTKKMKKMKKTKKTKKTKKMKKMKKTKKMNK